MKVLRLARIFGSLLRVFSVFFLIPLAASLYWDQDIPNETPFGDGTIPVKVTTFAFFGGFVVTLLTGYAASALAAGHEGELRERESLFVVGTSWLICALMGGIPFIVSGATRDPSIAFFESMSGLTTTGYSALALPLERYAESIHVWRATLHLFGGMGIVLIAFAIVSRLTEGGARMAGGEAGGDVERLRPKLSHTARSLAFVYMGLNFVAFVAFWFAFRFSPVVGSWKEAAYEAYVHSVASVATGGFSTRTASLAAFDSHTVIIVGTVAMLLGGISFPLYFRAVRQGIGIILRNHEFRFFITVILLAFLGVALFLYRQGQEPWFIIEHGLFQVISAIVTCGFTSTDPGAFPDGAKLIMLFLMFTGAMVGSTTGAIKISRIELLIRMTLDEIQRLLHPRAVTVARFAGRIIPEGSQRRVIAFFFAYVTTFIAGALALNLLGFDFSSSIVASAASLGGVGFGWGMAGGFADPILPAARVVGVLLMWMGRLEIFTVIILFFPRTYRD